MEIDFISTGILRNFFKIQLFLKKKVINILI